MSKRVPASMRTRESLRRLIEGEASTADGRGDLVKLATRLVLEEALEAESRDALGREYYAQGAEPGRGWRNGVRTGRLKTAEGFVEYAAPQITGRDEPFRSAVREQLQGRTQALEDLAVELLARGLSVRDIEDVFKDETGRLLLSRTAVSEIGSRCHYRSKFPQKCRSNFPRLWALVTHQFRRRSSGAWVAVRVVWAAAGARWVRQRARSGLRGTGLDNDPAYSAI